MTTHLYPTALAGLLDDSFDWTTEEIKAVLLTENFVFDPAAISVDEIPPEHIIATSLEGLTNRTFENGIAYGDPAQFLQLLSPLSISQVILYQDTGDPAYSTLVMHYDGENVIGAPMIPVGTDVFVYALFPPGGFLALTDDPFLGPLSTFALGDDVTITELSGGLVLVLPSVVLGGRLNVHTQVVCAPHEESESCCAPTIRSSRCD